MWIECRWQNLTFTLKNGCTITWTLFQGLLFYRECLAAAGTSRCTHPPLHLGRLRGVEGHTSCSRYQWQKSCTSHELALPQSPLVESLADKAFVQWGSQCGDFLQQNKVFICSMACIMLARISFAKRHHRWPDRKRECTHGGGGAMYLTKPKFSSNVAKAMFVCFPVPLEVHTAIFSSLDNLKEVDVMGCKLFQTKKLDICPFLSS